MKPDLYQSIQKIEKNSSSIEEFLTKLSYSENESFREYAASNKNTPVDCLKKLATDKSNSVRYFLSMNESLTPEILSILAKDSESSVRSMVAENYFISPEILAYLAEDECQSVRSAVADNRNTPIEVLGHLAEDPAWTVRWGVGVNPTTPLPVIWEMGKETVMNDIMEMLVQRREVPTEFLEMIMDKPGFRTEGVYQRIIQHSNVTKEILDKISAMDDLTPKTICMAIAKKLELEKHPNFLLNDFGVEP